MQRLIADIGGTNARFALVDDAGRLIEEQRLRVADFAGPAAAAKHVLAGRAVEEAVLAVATPVETDEVGFTNSPWRFRISALPGAIGVERVAVINDFVAQALALPHLADADLVKIGPGEIDPERPKGAIGPGTGLGVAGLVPFGGRWRPLPSEGGHTSFAPNDRRECAILAHLLDEHAHVSDERLISGPGLVTLARAIAGLDGLDFAATTPEEVARRAKAGSCPASKEAVWRLSGMLGSAAGDLALTLGALGGIYVCGGVCLELGALFDHDHFRARFETKGRLKPYLAAIPTYLVTNPRTGLIGAAHHRIEA